MNFCVFVQPACAYCARRVGLYHVRDFWHRYRILISYIIHCVRLTAQTA